MKRLRGITVPLVTPLTETSEIDVASLRKLVDHIIDAELDCLYPCGTTGEMMFLTEDERKCIAQTVVERAAGRVPVFVHVGSWTQDETIELARHAELIGADGIGVVTPACHQLRDDELVEFFCTVAQSVSPDFPVYLYAIPQCAVNDLNQRVCEEVARRCPNVIGVKCSFADMTKIQSLMSVNNGQFEVHVGPDHLLAASYAIGARGTVSGNAMIICEHYVQLWNALERGDFERAAIIQRRTNVLNDVMMGSPNNIAAYKALLKHEGVIATSKMRRPLRELREDQEATIIDALEKLKYHSVLI